LSPGDQEKYKNKSFNALNEPWAFSPDEILSSTSQKTQAAIEDYLAAVEQEEG